MSENTNDIVAEPAVAYSPSPKTSPRVSPRKPYTKLNVKKALQARIEGCSFKAIAKQQGVDKATVQKALNPLIKAIPNSEHLREYKANRADFFAAKQLELLHALSPDKVANMSGRDLVTASAILYDKERLESNLSTSNQTLAVLVSGVAQANALHGSHALDGSVDAEIIEE